MRAFTESITTFIKSLEQENSPLHKTASSYQAQGTKERPGKHVTAALCHFAYHNAGLIKRTLEANYLCPGCTSGLLLLAGQDYDLPVRQLLEAAGAQAAKGNETVHFRDSIRKRSAGARSHHMHACLADGLVSSLPCSESRVSISFISASHRLNSDLAIAFRAP